MSIALGVLTHFASKPAKDNLLFVFQPAEEGPGGAKPIMESTEFAEWRPDSIYGLHIAPEYKVGEIAIKPGLLLRIHRNCLFRSKEKVGTRRIPIWRMIWLLRQVRLLGKCKRL